MMEKYGVEHVKETYKVTKTASDGSTRVLGKDMTFEQAMSLKETFGESAKMEPDQSK